MAAQAVGFYELAALHIDPAKRLLWRDADLVAEGHSIPACVSRSTFESTPIPDEIRDRLQPYLEK
jgi:acyl-CoA thioesterase FadM